MADYLSPVFYDLLAVHSHIPDVREKLPSLLTGVRRSIVEIGAGTGLITTSLADWTPAEIFALEPSDTMRAVLLSRLAERPDLLERVTVLPCDALSLDLDEPVEAMVMINVLYALEPGYRRRLWPVLADRLEPGGLLLFTWRDGGPPKPRPMRQLDSRRVGRHTYTVSSEIIESDDERATCRYLYRITQGDEVLSEEELVGHAYRPAWETLRDELMSAGYVRTAAPDGLLAWRRT
ncbi:MULTISPECIES: class I SAM-dependent methyltransferase [unclassified Nonomuraea]|uniref:class I SAM-dependent methyltransferase n=1 Tax=unclassified Nonomuraea TaxID=2593643 RepID=UPI0033F9CB78